MNAERRNSTFIFIAQMTQSYFSNNFNIMKTSECAR